MNYWESTDYITLQLLQAKLQVALTLISIAAMIILVIALIYYMRKMSNRYGRYWE